MRILDLIEALTRDQYRTLRQKPDYNFDKNRYQEIFGGKWRIVLPVSVETNQDKLNKAETKVTKFLDNLGYEIVDYKAGLAKQNLEKYETRIDTLAKAEIDKFGLGVSHDYDTLNALGYDSIVADLKKKNKFDKRTVKIGGLLQSDPELLKLFMNDGSRSSKYVPQNNFAVVISRHPVDIGAMSTGQNWDSCMSLPDPTKGDIGGENCFYVPTEIAIGSVVAYLVTRGNENLKDKPIARILIKPYVNTNNPNDVALEMEGKVYYEYSKYSVNVPEITKFKDTVQTWLDNVNKLTNKKGTYHRHEKSYPDLDSSEAIEKEINIDKNSLEYIVSKTPEKYFTSENKVEGTSFYQIDDVKIQDAYLKNNSSYLRRIFKLDFNITLENINLNPNIILKLTPSQFNDNPSTYVDDIARSNFVKLLEAVINKNPKIFIDFIDHGTGRGDIRIEQEKMLVTLALDKDPTIVSDIDETIINDLSLDITKYIKLSIEKNPLSFDVIYRYHPESIDKDEELKYKYFDNAIKYIASNDIEMDRVIAFYSNLTGRNIDREKLVESVKTLIKSGYRIFNEYPNIRVFKNVSSDEAYELIEENLKTFGINSNFYNIIYYIREMTEHFGKNTFNISEVSLRLIEEFFNNSGIVNNILTFLTVDINEEIYERVKNISNLLLKNNKIPFSSIISFIRLVNSNNVELTNKLMLDLVNNNKEYFKQYFESNDLRYSWEDIDFDKVLKIIIRKMPREEAKKYVTSVIKQALNTDRTIKYCQKILYELSLIDVVQSNDPIKDFANNWGSETGQYNLDNNMLFLITEKSDFIDEKFSSLLNVAANKIVKQLKDSKDPLELLSKYYPVDIGSDVNSSKLSTQLNAFKNLRRLLQYGDNYEYFDALASGINFKTLHIDSINHRIKSLYPIIERINSERTDDKKPYYDMAKYDKEVYGTLVGMLVHLVMVMKSRDKMMKVKRIKDFEEFINLSSKFYNLYWKTVKQVYSEHGSSHYVYGDLEKMYQEKLASTKNYVEIL